MRISLLLLAAFALIGCDETSSAQSPNEKWAIAPAATSSDNGIFRVWRINTQTGALDVCVYATTWMQKDSRGDLHLASPKCSDAPTMPAAAKSN